MKLSAKTCRDSSRDRGFLVSILTPLLSALDPEKCAAQLVAEFHAGGAPVCPSCGAELNEIRAATFRAGKRTACSACRKQFTPWQGTPLERAHMTPVDFIVLRIALAAGLDHTGCRQLFVRHSQAITAWIKRLTLPVAAEEQLAGEGGGLQRLDDELLTLQPLPVGDIEPLQICPEEIPPGEMPTPDPI